jgi:nicotinamide mononucleotide transporter
MPSGLELAANLLVAGSIWLAARNSALTWWATIAGCALFAVLCYQHQLYADVVLQLFFILAAVWGLFSWRSEQALPIRQLPSKYLLPYLGAALLVAALYGALLHAWTDAYAPFGDSLVLTLSVLAQLLLIRRYLQNWGCWLLVNSIAIPLYYHRGLELTAAFYALYWFNAAYGLWQWRQWLSPDNGSDSAGTSADKSAG